MGALAVRDEGRPVVVDYDAQADVLYVRVGPAVPAAMDDDPQGFLWRTARSTGKTCGVTVLDFLQDGWQDRPRDFYKVLEPHFGYDTHAILREVALVVPRVGP